MSSNETVKFKYRIIIGDSADRPYQIQRKGWIFWKDISRESSVDNAKTEIQRLIRHEYRKPGMVVYEYDQEDHLTETLKGSK
jgi:hypothetical protein